MPTRRASPPGMEASAGINVANAICDSTRLLSLFDRELVSLRGCVNCPHEQVRST